MDECIVFDDCVLPLLTSMGKCLAGFPEQLVSDTVDYIKHLQEQGIDVETVKYVLLHVNDDTGVGYETLIEYDDSLDQTVDQVLLDKAVGVREFERMMGDQGNILRQLWEGCNQPFRDMLTLNISENVVTVEEHDGESSAIMLLDLHPMDGKNPHLLRGDLADVILENYRLLDDRSTALMISSEGGLYANVLTASMRIIGEAILESNPLRVQSWLNRTPEVFISRVDDDYLMVHGIVYGENGEVGAGPFLAMVKG